MRIHTGSNFITHIFSQFYVHVALLYKNEILTEGSLPQEELDNILKNLMII